MASVISSIYKKKLGKNSHYALKYSDLEACLANRTERGIYLDVWFTSQPRWREHPPRWLGDSEFKLVWLHYQHGYTPRYWVRDPPWKDEIHPIYVRCEVYPIPNEVSRKLSLSHHQLRDMLGREIEKVVGGHLFSHHWQVTLWLHEDDYNVECNSLAWEGVKLRIGTKTFVELSK